MVERRKHPRLAITVDVDISSGSNFYAGKSRDISVGGLFIETELGLPVGSQISVRMQLQNQQFTAQAEVMWALLQENGEPIGVGVRFLKLRPLMRKAIEEFMAVRGPLEQPLVEDDAGEEEPDLKKGPPPLPDGAGSAKK